VGQDVVAQEEVGAEALGDQLLGRSVRPKKRVRVGIPLALATVATLAAGSIPKAGIPRATKYCQQIAVVC